MTRKTLRETGIHDFFYYTPGEFNAITDVPGVKVGHSTIIEGDNCRTGVTVVVPEGFDKHRYVAGGFSFNANGEVTGLHYIFEEARLLSPIFLTNTYSVGDVFSAVIDYYKSTVPLPIIGECWDGYLNDIEGRHVKKANVVEAIERAKRGPVSQGSVGAGTGMTSFGFKAGIGTCSRKLTLQGNNYTVGVLVNNNIGPEDGHHRYLRVGGFDVGKVIGEDSMQEEVPLKDGHQNSSILVIATDIPLDHRQLNRISKHAVLGMGRVGIVSYSESGDFIIAFSMANKLPLRADKTLIKMDIISENLLNVVFEATIEAVEEAYLNSLFMAEDMEGKDGHVIKALPVDILVGKLTHFL